MCFHLLILSLVRGNKENTYQLIWGDTLAGAWGDQGGNDVYLKWVEGKEIGKKQSNLRDIKNIKLTKLKINFRGRGKCIFVIIEKLEWKQIMEFGDANRMNGNSVP